MNKMQARVGVAAASISVALVGLAGPASAASAESGQTAAVVVDAGSAAGASTTEPPFRSGATEAKSATAAAGWLGMCYVLPDPANSRGGGGWCDGNGPDARYYGRVTCSNGSNYYGPERWAGDRRGSYGICPSGTSRKSWSVYGYYV